MIGRLRRKADDLSRDAWMERRRSAARARRSLAILRRRLGSVAGLAASFSLGFIVGSLPAPETGGDDRRGRAAPGPVLAAGSRLLSAVALRYLASAAAPADGLGASLAEEFRKPVGDGASVK